RGEVFISRNARAIADLQRRGLADADLDPMLASRALSSMVSRVAYSMFGFGEGTDDGRVRFEEIVDTVTRIWANGLRMPSPGGGTGASGSGTAPDSEEHT